MYSRCNNPYVAPQHRCYGERGEFSIPLVDSRDSSYVVCEGGFSYNYQFHNVRQTMLLSVCVRRPEWLRLESINDEDFVNALYAARRDETIERQDSTEGQGK